MGRRLFILVFLTGLGCVASSGLRRYCLIPQPMSWTNAQNYCRSNHTDMAVIESAADLLEIQNLANLNKMSSNTWFGLYLDINSWHWSLRNEPLGSYIMWIPTTPDNSDGHEECAIVSSTGWNDWPCTRLFPFICFDENLSGADRYIYYSENKTWYESQTFCRQTHTDLASSRDATEFSTILDKISGNTWFGLLRNSWKWSDQTVSSYIPWMAGRPDNYERNENCGYLYHSMYPEDAMCSYQMPFFCYSMITERKIIRLKIQSDEDMENSAVKSEILEQIKQKVKDHGMEHITVKFRQQADGNMFHKLQENNSSGNQ